MSKKEIVSVYFLVKKYLRRSDLRYKKTNFLLPLSEENLEKNTDAVKDFEKYVIDDYMQSKIEWVSSLCAMYLYDKKTQLIVKENNCEDVVEMVLNNCNKHFM